MLILYIIFQRENIEYFLLFIENLKIFLRYYLQCISDFSTYLVQTAASGAFSQSPSVLLQGRYESSPQKKSASDISCNSLSPVQTAFAPSSHPPQCDPAKRFYVMKIRLCASAKDIFCNIRSFLQHKRTPPQMIIHLLRKCPIQAPDKPYSTSDGAAYTRAFNSLSSI